MISEAVVRLALATAGLCLLLAGGAFAEGRVYDDAESVQPLPVGARVPSAEVRSVDGAPLDLATLTAEQGALLVFYRGGW